MYPKHVTERIVELWALGFTAQETVTAIKEQQGKHIGLATIYRHRHNLTAQNLIDELLRHQERSILKADSSNPELAMKYRNELLKILLPTRIEAVTEHTERIFKIELSAKTESKTLCLNPLSESNTSHTINKPNSTKPDINIVTAQPSQV